MTNVTALSVQSEARWFTRSQTLAEQINIFNNLVKTAKPNGSAPCLLITPELAKHLLMNNAGNRRTSAKALDLYQEAMEENDWPVTGATIVVGPSGRILDGQHRLMACVNAGVAFHTYIVFGVDENQFTRIDTGRRRSNIDAFTIARVPYANHAAKAARWIAILRDDPLDRGVTYTNEDLLNFYTNDLDHDRFKLAVELAIAVNKGGKLIRPAQNTPVGSLAALFYFMLERNKRLTIEFADMLASNNKQAAKAIYGSISDVKARSNGRIHEVLRNAFIVNAWNLLRSGKSVTKKAIAWNGQTDDFPEIK